MTQLLAMLLIALGTITGHTAHTSPNHAVSYCANASASVVHGHTVITLQPYVC